MRARCALVLALAPGLACATDGPQTKPRDTGNLAADTAPDTGILDSAETGAETGGETGDDTGADTGPEPDPNTLDQDGDGFTPNEGDCDDERAHVHPGAPDYCDGLDADCDGESIPDGSCSEVGDPRLMWSWSFEGFSDSWGYVSDGVGDVDGDGREDAGVEGGTGSEGLGGVLLGSGSDTWPARGPTPGLVWRDNFPEWHLSTGAMAGGDVNDDGYDDVWASTGTAAGYPGGIFLMLGRSGWVGDDVKHVDDAADVKWLNSAGPEFMAPVGVGTMSDDAYSDMVVITETTDGDAVWRLIRGEPAPTGSHQINEIEDTVHLDMDANELTSRGTVMQDLDGDGLDELVVSTTRLHGDDAMVMFLEGENLTGGAALADAGTDAWLDTAGEVVVGVSGTSIGDSGDVDGDGLNDTLFWITAEDGGDVAWSMALFSGGIPDGEFSALQTVSVCAAAGERFEYGGWQADVDGDGVRDVQGRGTRGWTTMPSTTLREGGVQMIDDLRGPVTDWSSWFSTTADFNGDGLPEWVYYDQQWDDPELADEFGRTLILTGFEIPWDDPTKW